MVKTREEIAMDWAAKQSLSPSQKAMELELRPQLLDALNRWNTSRFDMGRVLVKYREHFKGLYLSLYAALGVPERKARRLIEDYERAKLVDEPARVLALCQGFDIAEKKHEFLGDALAAIKATDEVEIEEAVLDAVAAYKKARKEARAVPETVLEEFVPDEEIEPVVPVKSKARKRLDKNFEDALSWFTEDELADALADLVKAKRLKKAA